MEGMASGTYLRTQFVQGTVLEHLTLRREQAAHVRRERGASGGMLECK